MISETLQCCSKVGDDINAEHASGGGTRRYGASSGDRGDGGDGAPRVDGGPDGDVEL